MRFKTLALATASLIVVSIPFSANAQQKPVLGTWGYDSSSMDSSVKPGDDFWAYVNGGWNKRTVIAADHPSIGSFITLRDSSQADVRQIAERLANAHGRDRQAQQIGDYYTTFMDEGRINAAGTAPLKPYLSRIAAVNSRDQLLSLFVTPGYARPVAIGIFADPKQPTRYAVAATQATLGMPSREYYLGTDPKMVAHRAAYRNYIVNIEKLAGLPGGEAAADRILEFETALSKVQWAAAERRDIDKTYNPMSRAQLEAFAPQFDWGSTLTKAGLGSTRTVIVREPSAVQESAKLLASVPLSTWKEWLAFRFVSDHADVLPTAISDASFDFYSKELTGVQQQQPRWKRAVNAVDGALGEEVGSIYVKTHYPAQSEKQMSELIGNLRAAYKQKISASSWMDETTRKAALEKLAAFDPRIGHPVRYIDYSALKVVKGDALGNAIRAADFQYNLQLKRFPKPVDRSLWGMTPQTVNAYYSPSTNQVTFPAAILQPPFFDPNADPAVNYGAIGAVIGHEMGHGFDDQGRKFDPVGMLRDWWTPQTSKAYAEKTQRLGAQYDAFSPYPGVHVNGKLTMGENIGDLSGIEAAYAAYKMYTAKHGEPPVIDGLTGDQRFFIAFAQVWQSKDREDAERRQILTDPHSPARYRTNGVVRNVDAWYKAFNVQPGDKLYLPPEQRVHIW